MGAVEVHDVSEVLAAGKSAHRATRWILWLSIIVSIAGLAVAILAIRSRRAAASTRYTTAAVTRGDLTVTVSATGNLQPTTQVDVGSELSGTIESVDVDQNDRVTKGQVLARLDVSKLQDQVRRAQAALKVSESRVVQAQATRMEVRTNLMRMRRAVISSGESIYSQHDLDAADAAVKRAVAEEASAVATVDESRAALQSDLTNVSKASIRSPIDGIVLARQIEPGQTVAASLQAPVLFTIAQNLEQMKVEVDIDEAEVAQVRPGQKATFTVDAWPDRQYVATVQRVGLGAQSKEGVVSYLTVLTFDNKDLSLRPGMTATADIITNAKSNVLLVPNAALRFTPATTTQSRGVVGALMPRGPGMRRPGNEQNGQRVWVLRDGVPTAIAVRAGATNGQVTEVRADELQPGMKVITDASSGSS